MDFLRKSDSVRIVLMGGFTGLLMAKAILIIFGMHIQMEINTSATRRDWESRIDWK